MHTQQHTSPHAAPLLAVALTPRQAAVLLLRAGRGVARRPCAGLEAAGAALVAAAFDPLRAYRAYGLTEGAPPRARHDPRARTHASLGRAGDQNTLALNPQTPTPNHY